jgi:two-component system chemotaxis response regulator CheY
MTSHIGPAATGRLCVLLVEDNEHMRMLLRTLLTAMGIRKLHEYSGGAEALAELSRHKPDFILTDLSMAPMDGLAFTRAVRRNSNKAVSLLPIVMVTGHTERRRIEAARDAGITEILAKPITASGLFQRIEEIVLRPRPFVGSANYVGPCRRRHANPDHTGPWRRQDDLETVAVDALPEPGEAANSSKGFSRFPVR